MYQFFCTFFSYFYCWNIDLSNGKPYSNVIFLEDSWWCSNTMNLGFGVSFFSWDLYFIKLFTHCNDLFPKNSRNQIYIFLCTYILTKWFVILPFLKVGIVLYITNIDHWYFLILWCIFLGSGNTVLRVSREHLQLVLYYLRDTDRAIRGFHKLWFAAGIQCYTYVRTYMLGSNRKKMILLKFGQAFTLRNEKCLMSAEVLQRFFAYIETLCQVIYFSIRLY